MNIVPGLYRHYKGGFYKVLGLATHTETEEILVLYETVYCKKTGLKHAGKYWIRPCKMFHEKVELNGKIINRFTLQQKI
jgi:hypothetical protein